MNRRRPQAAAIFDLDRTLIAGPSGPAFSSHLGSGRDRPALAARGRRRGRRRTSCSARRRSRPRPPGWPPAPLPAGRSTPCAAAAEAAADELVEKVQPYAPGVMDEHREAGRLLVHGDDQRRNRSSPRSPTGSASTPSSRRAGPPPTAPTRARSTGRSCGAAASWRRCGTWATDAGVDLRGSWAYSDSYYDAPLLAAVGHPAAVNADVRLVALARLKGWPLRHFDLPEGCSRSPGASCRSGPGRCSGRSCSPTSASTSTGIEKIPRTGR